VKAEQVASSTGCNVASGTNAQQWNKAAPRCQIGLTLRTADTAQQPFRSGRLECAAQRIHVTVIGTATATCHRQRGQQRAQLAVFGAMRKAIQSGVQ
jgi:hypothetical protein